MFRVEQCIALKTIKNISFLCSGGRDKLVGCENERCTFIEMCLLSPIDLKQSLKKIKIEVTLTDWQLCFPNICNSWRL